MGYSTVEIEKDLVFLVTQIPKVKEISVMREDDYRISFLHSGAPCSLEFKSERGNLIAYADGQNDCLPDEVKEYIGSSFPESRYRREIGPGKDGFHFWHRVKEVDLDKIAHSANHP